MLHSRPYSKESLHNVSKQVDFITKTIKLIYLQISVALGNQDQPPILDKVERLIWLTLFNIANPLTPTCSLAALKKLFEDIPWDDVNALSAAESSWFSLLLESTPPDATSSALPSYTSLSLGPNTITYYNNRNTVPLSANSAAPRLTTVEPTPAELISQQSSSANSASPHLTATAPTPANLISQQSTSTSPVALSSVAPSNIDLSNLGPGSPTEPEEPPITPMTPMGEQPSVPLPSPGAHDMSSPPTGADMDMDPPPVNDTDGPERDKLEDDEGQRETQEKNVDQLVSSTEMDVDQAVSSSFTLLTSICLTHCIGHECKRKGQGGGANQHCSCTPRQS